MIVTASLEESSTETSSSQMGDQSWINWFCSVKDNHFFCRIDKAYIEDSFNLYGLRQYCNDDFNDALDIILDRTEVEDATNHQLRIAEILYGLIHARYIISGQGLVAMHKKFVAKEFGECPRTCCNGQAALPVGISDEPGLTSVKIFCPKCRDIYNPSAGLKHIDGAYFGTAFPHMFMMTFENLVPFAPTHQYVARIFGFKLHSTNVCTPKVPPADASTLSLPSLERRDIFQSRLQRKPSNSDDNSSQLTFEETLQMGQSSSMDNLNTTTNSGAPVNVTTKRGENYGSKTTSTDLISSVEHNQDFIAIQNEHMKEHSDKHVASPHIDKKPRKS